MKKRQINDQAVEDMRTSFFHRRDSIATQAYKDFWSEDDLHGLWERGIDRVGISVPQDHFRSGVIPTGYAWAGAPFGGAPAALNYTYANTYLNVSPDAIGTRHFLYDAITVYANKRFYARLGTSTSGSIGIRYDDGTDTNYRETYLYPNGVFYHWAGAWRDGGARNLVVVGNPYGRLGEMYSISAFCYLPVAAHQMYVYSVMEMGLEAGSIVIGGAIAWVPARVGIVVNPAAAHVSTGLVDWIYSTFT